MKLRYVRPAKLKVIVGMFFGTGGFGILMGLQFEHFYLTMLGTINLCLGGFCGWLLLTQKPRRDSRKRRRDGDDQDR